MVFWLRSNAPGPWVWLGRFASGAVVWLLAATASAQVGPSALSACLEFGFSTEEDFVTRGPEPIDGNPIISDGDLLSSVCGICARNTDLLGGFDVPANFDLGLDAADVVTDGREVLAAFSTELDSPFAGQFTAGDLLATSGMVIPNVVLTAGFAIGYDLGLDAVHFVGDPVDIVDFLNVAAQISRVDWLNDPQVLADLLGEKQVDILFSTEGTAPAPLATGFLDGDVLSALQGLVVVSHAQLFPASVPAGIPTRGVDFGLDALGTDRDGGLALIQLSTEIGFSGDPAFGDQDLLAYQAGVIRTGASLVACFEPLADDLGLDAVLPEPTGVALLVAGLAHLGALTGLRARSARRKPGGVGPAEGRVRPT